MVRLSIPGILISSKMRSTLSLINTFAATALGPRNREILKTCSEHTYKYFDSSSMTSTVFIPHLLE